MIQLPGNDDVAATAEGNSSLYSHRRRTTQTPKDIRKSLKFNTNMSFSSYSVPQGIERQPKGFLQKSTSMTTPGKRLKRLKRFTVSLPPSRAGCVLYNVPPQSCIPRAEKKKTTTPNRVRISCEAVISSVMVTILNNFIGKAVEANNIKNADKTYHAALEISGKQLCFLRILSCNTLFPTIVSCIFRPGS